MTKPHVVSLIVLIAVTIASAGFGLTHFAAGHEVSPKELVVQDLFGRTLNSHGLTLVDWEGHLANPAIKFYRVPALIALLSTRTTPPASDSCDPTAHRASATART